MKHIIFKANIILCAIALVYSSSRSNNHHHKDSDNAMNQESNDIESLTCDTLIVFDLSKNVTSKDVFDITIKIFLNYIRQFCQKFKYTVMDESFASENKDGRDVKECDDDLGCEEDIFLMDYNAMTLGYTDERYDSTSNLSKIYFQFLNATLSTMRPCVNYSILLLTNRIVFMNIDDGFMQMFETLNIKLTIIHLGRNNTISTMDLEPAYANFPNTKALSFANFDCLSYLLYCILPCSNDAVECLAADVEDCHHFSKFTPNDNPDQTLHIWFVEVLTEYGTDQFDTILDNIVQGMQDYVDTFGIQHLRFQFISGEADNSLPCEGIESIGDGCQIGTEHIDIDDPPIGNDDGSANVRLNLVPRSKTITKARTGILSVIILTDFALPNFVTFNGYETLHAQMYVYNAEAFEYYSNKFSNVTNLNISFLDWFDVVSIVPLEKGEFIPSTPSSIPAATTTFEKTHTTEINTFASDSETLKFTEIISRSTDSVKSSTTSSSKNSVNKNEQVTLQCFKYFILLIVLIRYFFP